MQEEDRGVSIAPLSAERAEIAIICIVCVHYTGTCTIIPSLLRTQASKPMQQHSTPPLARTSIATSGSETVQPSHIPRLLSDGAGAGGGASRHCARAAF